MMKRFRVKLNAGEVTFGLREAVIMSIVGMAIGIAAAVHYAG
jgi:hypothetical protein